MLHHEAALKHIGRYMKGTIDKGLILTPTDKLQVDCFTDADFAYGHEDAQVPHCIQSCTGFAFFWMSCAVKVFSSN